MVEAKRRPSRVRCRLRCFSNDAQPPLSSPAARALDKSPSPSPLPRPGTFMAMPEMVRELTRLRCLPWMPWLVTRWMAPGLAVDCSESWPESCARGSASPSSTASKCMNSW
eukprot:3934416-Rhodomonas_salina.3